MRAPRMSDGAQQRRRRMVEGQLLPRGVRDRAVLEAMGRVPRERFIPRQFRDFAYQDGPVPIGGGQTVSQPFIVARMAEALRLRGRDRVLEVGTGSGYAAAVLSQLAAEVITVERRRELARDAADRLASLGYNNIHVVHGDGTEGHLRRAPYDAIAVAAAGPTVPTALQEQLAVGGRLVIPVGRTMEPQRLVRVVRRDEDRFDEERLGDVRFVPLIGAEGWHAA